MPRLGAVGDKIERRFCFFGGNDLLIFLTWVGLVDLTCAGAKRLHDGKRCGLHRRLRAVQYDENSLSELSKFELGKFGNSL